jgi:hypothetical protein
VRHFHVVFTLPASLRRIFRSHARVMTSVLFSSATRALMEMTADPKHLGARVGILAVLHTWGGNLSYHPHLHCLVPAGGLSDDGVWLPTRPKFLLPIPALSRFFRGKFIYEAKRRLPQVQFPKDLRDHDWKIGIFPRLRSDNVLGYLGRYVHRTAIANSRILAATSRTVTFRYLDHRDHKSKVMTLDTFEFMRRVLQHVPPRGMHRVRSYGLYHHAHKARFEAARDLLEPPKPPSPTITINLVATSANLPRCPYCGSQNLVTLESFLPKPRPPPSVLVRQAQNPATAGINP